MNHLSSKKINIAKVIIETDSKNCSQRTDISFIKNTRPFQRFTLYPRPITCAFKQICSDMLTEATRKKKYNAKMHSNQFTVQIHWNWLISSTANIDRMVTFYDINCCSEYCAQMPPFVSLSLFALRITWTLITWYMFLHLW